MSGTKGIKKGTKKAVQNVKKGVESVTQNTEKSTKEVADRMMQIVNQFSSPKSAGSPPVRPNVNLPTLAQRSNLPAVINHTGLPARRIIEAPVQYAQYVDAIPVAELSKMQKLGQRLKGLNYKKLGRLGLLGTVGLGAYNYFSSPEEDEEQESQKTPDRYRWVPNGGWQEYNEQTGQYEAQKPGFGVDRFGNTNYYNGSDWLNPDQYIQGSNGQVYDKATGQIIGNADDMLLARNSGYNNIFDWRAAQAGFNSPEQVKALQQQLGLTADGKWGQQTQNAYEAAQNINSPYNISNLFTMYQRGVGQ